MAMADRKAISRGNRRADPRLGGMSEEVGLVSADPSAHNGSPSAQLQGEIDSAVRALIAHQASRAEAIVREHATALDAIARALIDRGVLMAVDVIAIADHHGVPLAQVAVERAADLVEA